MNLKLFAVKKMMANPYRTTTKNSNTIEKVQMKIFLIPCRPLLSKNYYSPCTEITISILFWFS